jgi:hypothetical protein
LPEENSSTNGEENVLVEVIDVDQPLRALLALLTLAADIDTLGGHDGVDGFR